MHWLAEKSNALEEMVHRRAPLRVTLCSERGASTMHVNTGH
jgi:hypothetical protein